MTIIKKLLSITFKKSSESTSTMGIAILSISRILLVCVVFLAIPLLFLVIVAGIVAPVSLFTRIVGISVIIGIITLLITALKILLEWNIK